MLDIKTSDFMSFVGETEMARRMREHDWASSPLGPIAAWPPSLQTLVQFMLASPLVASIVCGPERLLLYNDTAARLYGARHPFAFGRPLAESFPESYPLIASFYDRVFAGESVHVPAQPLDLHGNGSRSVFDAYLTPIYGEKGNVEYAFMTGFEIGERLRAEAERDGEISKRRESEDQLRLALDVAELGTWTWNVQSNTGYLDSRSAEIVGLPAGPLANVGEAQRASIHPDDRTRVEEQIRTGITGSEPFSLHYRVIHSDGSVHFVASRAQAFRSESGTPLRLVGTNRDVTTERLAEIAGRETEERQAFLLKLSDALRPLADPHEVKTVATRLLGEHLGVNRAFYADADHGRWLVTTGYEQGVERLPHEAYLMADYGLWIIDDFRAGRRLLVRDVGADNRFQRSERAALEALQISGAAAVPLVKQGALVAMLALHTAAPRDWTEQEFALIEETAARTWAAVERARAEAALRESEAKLAVELADTRQLHRISSRLIVEDNIDALYAAILEVARSLMRSEMASIQRLVPERRQLFLLAQHGFAPESAEFWQWVAADSTTSCGVTLAHGDPVIVSDVETWELVAGTEDLRQYRLSRIRALLSAPLVSRDGRLVGVMSTHWREVHEPSERELRLLDVLARQAADLIERSAADAALRESEERYRTLFESIDEGFCLIEVLFDAGGRPVDYRFLETNPAFERQTGLADVIGRTMRELEPGHEQHWFDIYGRIAVTGDPERFERPAEALGHWYDVYAFRVGKPEQRRVALLFNDIAERKRAEAAVRESEQRFRALVTAGTYSIYRMSPDWRFMYQLDSRSLANTSGPIENWVEKYILHGDLPRVYAAIEQAVRTKSLFELEHRILLADGSIGWVRSRAVPMLGPNGEITEWFGAGSDVTERRAVVERLRESEERLALAFKTLPIGIAIIDAKGEIVVANDEMRRFLPTGLIPSRDPERVPRWTGLDAEGGVVPPENFPGARALRGESVSPGLQMIYQGEDGHETWTEVLSAPLWGEDGQVTGALTVVIDVDRTKRSEEAARASEERLRLALSVGELATWDWNLLTGAVVWSDEHFTMQGYAVGEVEPSYEALVARVHPEDRAGTIAAIENARDRRSTYCHNFRLLHSDGTIRRLSAQGHFFYDERGTAIRMIGVMRDVTQPWLAEERLRESEQRFRLLVDNVQEYALFQTDLGGTITSWNPGAERLFGYSTAEMLGVSGNLLFTPEDQKAGLLEQEIARVRAGGHPKDERWMVCKEGRRFWAQWITEPVRDEIGELRGVVKVLRDESERQQADQAIRASLAEKEELLKEVHHRVKNNLQVIVSLLNLQATQIEEQRVLALFEETRNRVQAIASIHEQIYRSESFASIHLTNYAHQLAPDLVRFYGLEQRIRVEIVGDGATLELERAVPYGMLLNELVSNACKHAFPPSQTGTMTIRIQPRGDFIELTVSDSGQGLPAGFDYRRTSSLGLKLVHGLVRQLRGTLQIQSEAGTTVQVRFPATGKEAEE